MSDEMICMREQQVTLSKRTPPLSSLSVLCILHHRGADYVPVAGARAAAAWRNGRGHVGFRRGWLVIGRLCPFRGMVRVGRGSQLASAGALGRTRQTDKTDTVL